VSVEESRASASTILAVRMPVPGYSSSMQAVWLAVPEHILEERRQLGLDKRDELWDGVLHMVPPPSLPHASVGMELALTLAPLVKRRGWRIVGDAAGLFDHDRNYRIPDLAVYAPHHAEHRGIRGAQLVVEMLSPHDEARQKFPFYARMRVCEIWLVEPMSREHEIHVLHGDHYVRAETIAGRTRSEILDVALELAEGPVLRLHMADSIVDI